MISKLSLKNECATHLAGHLAQTGHFTFKVSTWSMYPALKPGDQLTIQSAPLYQPNDILVFNLEGKLHAHRLVSLLSGGLFQTQGDACESLDPPLLERSIYGKVTQVTRAKKTYTLPNLPPAHLFDRWSDRFMILFFNKRAALAHRLHESGVKLADHPLLRALLRIVLTPLITYKSQPPVAQQGPVYRAVIGNLEIASYESTLDKIMIRRWCQGWGIESKLKSMSR